MVDAVSDAPLYSGRKVRQAQSVFMAGARSGDPLGGISGVRPGTPDSTATISGLDWTINPHGGFLDVQAAMEASGYAYVIDAAKTGTIDAADATYARKGRVWVQLSDPAEDESTIPGLTFGYTAGAADGQLSYPALPTRAFHLATVNQPKADGGNATITFDAQFTVSAGGIRPVRTKADLDAWTTAGVGAHAYVFADPTLTLNGDYTMSAAGWAVPGATGMVGRSAASVVTPPAGQFADISANGNWNLAGAVLPPGITYNNGFVIRDAGIYRVNLGLTANSQFFSGATVNSAGAPASPFADVVAAVQSSPNAFIGTGSGLVFIPAGGIVRFWVEGLVASIAIGSGAATFFSVERTF